MLLPAGLPRKPPPVQGCARHRAWLGASSQEGLALSLSLLICLPGHPLLPSPSGMPPSHGAGTALGSSLRHLGPKLHLMGAQVPGTLSPAPLACAILANSPRPSACREGASGPVLPPPVPWWPSPSPRPSPAMTTVVSGFPGNKGALCHSPYSSATRSLRSWNEHGRAQISRGIEMRQPRQEPSR